MADEYGSHVRVVVVPFDWESETNTIKQEYDSLASDEEFDVEANADDLYPSLQESVFNPSQNNNAKRSRVRSSSLSRTNSRNRHRHIATPALDGRSDRALFPKIIRTEDSKENERDRALFPKIIRTEDSKDNVIDEIEANVPRRVPGRVRLPDVRRSRSRDNLLLDQDDLEQVGLGLGIRPVLSVGAIHLAELPNRTSSGYRGRHMYGKSRWQTSRDILDEWRKAGLLKERAAGLAFEIPLKPPPSLPTLGPHKPQRIHRLESVTSLHNREFDAESYFRRLDEKQRTAFERRNRATSAIKERLALQLQQRTQQAKERYEEVEDYKQRTAHMKIIEKQSQCAANRERQENEFRQRIKEERRRRDKVRKRAKRQKKKQKADKSKDVNSDRPDDRDENVNNPDEPMADPNDDPGEDTEVDEHSEESAESSPQKQRYYSEFGY